MGMTQAWSSSSGTIRGAATTTTAVLRGGHGIKPYEFVPSRTRDTPLKKQFFKSYFFIFFIFSSERRDPLANHSRPTGNHMYKAFILCNSPYLTFLLLCAVCTQLRAYGNVGYALENHYTSTLRRAL